MQKKTGKTRVVIVGNGFGGIYTLKYLHKFLCGEKDIEISLIGERNYFLFTPLLHEVATGGLNPENIVEPIRKVLGCCISKFYLGKAKKVDLREKTVEVNGVKIPYDYLVLAPGSETNFYNVPGGREHSLTLKSIEDAVKIKNRIIAQIERASHMGPGPERKKTLAIAVVGGGPTGVELAAELQELIKETFSSYYPKDLIDDASVFLIHKDRELMPQFGKKLREKSLKFLTKKGLKIMLGSEVREVAPSKVILKDGREIATETIIWAAGVKPSELEISDNINSQVSRNKSGKLIVDEYLRLAGHKNIFALGDSVVFTDKNGKNLPALAQVATKEAKTVAKNIYRSIRGGPLQPFKYRHSGYLVSLGQWMAVGEVAGFSFSGRIAWWLWRTVYLFKMLSFRKKVKVATDWTVNLFYPRDISEL